MSKTTNCIKMLEMLYGKEVVSKQELAQALQTNFRNIVEYKRELEKAGYIIKVTRGMYGGYKLVRDKDFHARNLTDTDKEVLREANAFLSHNTEFMHSKELMTAVGKVLSDATLNDVIKDKISIDRFPLLMSKEDLIQRYTILEQAIANKNKIIVTYNNLNGDSNKKYIFHPYELFIYDDAWYILGYVEFRNQAKTIISQEPIYLKLNRIVDIEVMKEKFYPFNNFDKSKYIDKNGMSKIGEKYHLKLLLKDQSAILASERKYSDEQIITRIDSNHIILECDMRNESRILSFINYFGSNCIVLEPEYIKNLVRNENQKMMINNSNNKKTVFFDFNGTILDDVDLCLNILNQMLTERNYTPVSKERYLEIFTFPIEEYYKEAGFNFDVHPFKELSKEFIKLYQKASLDCKLNEGVIELLDYLKENHFNIVLLTASEYKNVCEQLRHFNIMNYFNEVLATDNIYAVSKVQKGLNYINNYNIDKSKSIMIGDTLHDLEVSRELGISCVLYSNGHQAKSRLEKENVTIDNILDLKKYLL